MLAMLAGVAVLSCTESQTRERRGNENPLYPIRPTRFGVLAFYDDGRADLN